MIPFRATYKNEETVLIVAILAPDPDRDPQVAFIHGDGRLDYDRMEGPGTTWSRFTGCTWPKASNE